MPRYALLARLALGAMLITALAQCGGDEGDWPQLAPTDALLAQPAALQRNPVAQDPAAAAAPMVGRANALRKRAEALRKRPVIDPATAARMQAAVDGA